MALGQTEGDAGVAMALDAGQDASAELPVAASAPEPKAPERDVEHWYQRIKPSGFARIGGYLVFPFRDQELVGSNAGFRVASARVGASFHPWDDVNIVTSIDLSAPLRSSADPTQGTRIVALADAFVDYTPFEWLHVRTGQFRVPFYAEALYHDGQLPFVTRSVLFSGYEPPEAYAPREGLALDRQVGFQISSAMMGGETVKGRYAVAVVNGNGPNELFNDNNVPAALARVEIELLQVATLGVNGYVNSTVAGVRPNRTTTVYVGYGADLTVRVMGLQFLAAFLGRSADFGPGLTPDASLGVIGQAAYRHEGTGLEAGVRFAFLEPSAAQVSDQVTETAAFVGFRPSTWPLRTILQYTHHGEEAAVSLPNDSLDLLLQATFD